MSVAPGTYRFPWSPENNHNIRCLFSFSLDRFLFFIFARHFFSLCVSSFPAVIRELCRAFVVLLSRCCLVWRNCQSAPKSFSPSAAAAAALVSHGNRGVHDPVVYSSSPSFPRTVFFGHLTQHTCSGRAFSICRWTRRTSKAAVVWYTQANGESPLFTLLLLFAVVFVDDPVSVIARYGFAIVRIHVILAYPVRYVIIMRRVRFVTSPIRFFALNENNYFFFFSGKIGDGCSYGGVSRHVSMPTRSDTNIKFY